MSEEVAEFQQSVDDIEMAYRKGLRAFADWFAENWTITPDEWKRDFSDKCPSDDWIAGYNAGVEGVKIALDSFLDEAM
jgi:hypothetical protein